MKNIKLLACLISIVMILGACGKKAETGQGNPQAPVVTEQSQEGQVAPGSLEDDGQPDELIGEYIVDLVRYGTYLYPSCINPNFSGKIALEKGGGLFSFGGDTVIDDWFYDGQAVAMMMGETMAQLPWAGGVIAYDADENVTLYFTKDDADLHEIPLCSFEDDIPGASDIPGEYYQDFVYYEGDGLVGINGNRATILFNDDGTGLFTDSGEIPFTWTLDGAELDLDLEGDAEDMALSYRGGILSEKADGVTLFYVDRENGADLTWLPCLEDLFGVQQTEASNERAAERVIFSDIMGINGYYTEESEGEGYPFYIRTYYSDLGRGDEPVGLSFGFEIDDYAADADGDGVTELLCNCRYGGDGHCELNVFRLKDGKALCGIVYPEELDLEDFYNWGVNSYATYYNAETAQMILEYTSEKDNSKTNVRVLTMDDFVFSPVSIN